MIELRQRDQQILRLCYEQQFILTEHIERWFKNHSYRECRRRISELTSAGYLREENPGILGRKPVIRLTTQGVKVAETQALMRLTQSRTLSPATLMHDAYVTHVRLRLAEFWPAATFVPERAIKETEYRQVPDGLYFFANGNGVAIEIENSDKGRSRFLRLLDRWENVPKIVFVLYVATTPVLFEAVKKFLAATKVSKPLGVVQLTNLMQGKPQVWTVRGQIPLFEREQY